MSKADIRAAAAQVDVRRHATWLRPPWPARPVVALSCCDYVTDWHTDEQIAALDMAEHLVTAHPDEWGRCARCGLATDHFRMVAGPLGTAHLCMAHSPAMSEASR